MNDQLKDQLTKWKAEEWERTVQRYAQQNHDPSALENRRKLPVYFANPGPALAGKFEDQKMAA